MEILKTPLLLNPATEKNGFEAIWRRGLRHLPLRRGRPIKISSGIVSSEPPPAIVFTNPAKRPDPISKKASINDMLELKFCQPAI